MLESKRTSIDAQTSEKGFGYPVGSPPGRPGASSDRQGRRPRRNCVFKEKSVNDAQPSSADRMVGQKDMGVGTDRRKSSAIRSSVYDPNRKGSNRYKLDMHALPASFASHGGSEGGA